MSTERQTQSVSHNLSPEILGELDPSPDNPLDPLLKLRRFAELRALDTIEWYLAHKGGVAFWSKALRMTAIVLGTAGSVLPLIGGTPLLDGPHGMAAAKYGYVLLALSGATVLLDKLFGLSSRWMRYMTTAMAIQRHLAAFEMDWSATWLEIAGQKPTEEQRKRLIKLARAFRLAVVDEMALETQTWVAEFQSGMAQLERQAQIEQRIKTEPGLTKALKSPGETSD